MSYDLTARKDETFSEKVPRADVTAIIASLPNIEDNGPGSFMLKRGDELYMEIDAELVSEEGDNIEEDLANPGSEVNCINFHIPYAFMGTADECLPVAKIISDKLGWELLDCQSGRIVGVNSASSRKRPWWKFF